MNDEAVGLQLLRLHSVVLEMTQQDVWRLRPSAAAVDGLMWNETDKNLLSDIIAMMAWCQDAGWVEQAFLMEAWSVEHDEADTVTEHFGHVGLWLVLFLSDFQGEHQENKLCGANGEEVRGPGSTAAPWQERRTSSCWGRPARRRNAPVVWFLRIVLFGSDRLLIHETKSERRAFCSWSTVKLGASLRRGRAPICRSTPRFIHMNLRYVRRSRLRGFDWCKQSEPLNGDCWHVRKLVQSLLWLQRKLHVIWWVALCDVTQWIRCIVGNVGAR